MRSLIEELRELLSDDDVDDLLEVGRGPSPGGGSVSHFPFMYKGTLGPGPRGKTRTTPRKDSDGKRDVNFMWHCQCPGGTCKCTRKLKSGGTTTKTWTVRKGAKKKYDAMYRKWRKKSERG